MVRGPVCPIQRREKFLAFAGNRTKYHGFHSLEWSPYGTRNSVSDNVVVSNKSYFIVYIHNSYVVVGLAENGLLFVSL
jgi:hypothetical protein